MEYLLLTDQEILQNTVLGGNVDTDKYKFCVQDAQLSKLVEILGEDLYDKIKIDFENDNLTGDYLELYTKYIRMFLIHQSAVEYLINGAFQISNGGIFKMTPQNATAVEQDSINILIANQRNKAEIYQGRMEAFLSKNHLPEYVINSENIINPKKSNYGGFSFL
jgi:hypothetical protein